MPGPAAESKDTAGATRCVAEPMRVIRRLLKLSLLAVCAATDAFIGMFSSNIRFFLQPISTQGCIWARARPKKLCCRGSLVKRRRCAVTCAILLQLSQTGIPALSAPTLRHRVRTRSSRPLPAGSRTYASGRLLTAPAGCRSCRHGVHSGAANPANSDCRQRQRRQRHYSGAGAAAGSPATATGSTATAWAGIHEHSYW